MMKIMRRNGSKVWHKKFLIAYTLLMSSVGLENGVPRNRVLRFLFLIK